MKKETKIVYSTANGFCNMLFITFLVLKLCKVIDWSWWWVTAPLWIPLAVLAVIGFILFFLLICAAACTAGNGLKNKQ